MCWFDLSTTIRTIPLINPEIVVVNISADGQGGTPRGARDPEQSQPPPLALQGPSAPLGITFYRYKEKEIISSDDESLASFSKANPCANDKPFPQTMDGYAFTAFHGYKVVFKDNDC